MKRKVKEFVQHLYHEIDDEERAEKYLDESLPLIGTVVMYFNSLEQSLDSQICEVISDRSDALGLIVIHKLAYAAKVDLFKRLCEEFHRCVDTEPPAYGGLVERLKKVGELRNLVVHADWQNTDEEGYTYVRLRMAKQGLTQEYVQFSSESLEKLLNEIAQVNQQLSDYWEETSQAFSHGAASQWVAPDGD